RPPRAGGLLPDRGPEDERPAGLHRPAAHRRRRRQEGQRQHPVSESPGAPATTLEEAGLAAARRAGSISGPPSAWDYAADQGFRGLAWAAACLILVLLAAILWEIGVKAGPGIRDYGLGFLTSTTWDVNRGQFGILPEIWGTLYSSFLALLVGGFFGVAMAIFLTQDFLPPRTATVFRTVVELLAAIPSVVYGLWGLFVVVPAMRPPANWLFEKVGWIPFFGSTLSGPGLAPASLGLAIMV